MRPKHIVIMSVVIALVSTSSSFVAAFDFDSYETPRPRITNRANWSDLQRELRTADRSGQTMSGHVTSSEDERRSESHTSGNYFQGESSGLRNLDGAGLNHGADLNHMDGAGDNPHYVYGGQPSSLGDPSVQELSR